MGGSVLGLSDVITVRSQSLAAVCPIRGRLVLSRLPPHPNTQIILPVAENFSADSTFSRASGV